MQNNWKNKFSLSIYRQVIKIFKTFNQIEIPNKLDDSMEELHASPEKSAVQRQKNESSPLLIQVPLFLQKSGGQEGPVFSQCVP